MQTTTNQTETVSVPVVPSVRRHTQLLISEIIQWTSECERDHNAFAKDRCDLWKARLASVTSEAIFMGFSRVVTVTRGLAAAISSWQFNTKVEMSVEQRVALTRTLQALQQITERPLSKSGPDVRLLLIDLQEAFQLSNEELAEPSTVANPTTACGELDARIEMPKHVDMSVYSSARIDPLDRCVEEESWIVTQLATLAEDLACGGRGDRPAHRLMNVLRNHRFFREVDRVCIAGRVCGTNQLVVADAAIGERCSESVLKKGYSCFVNPQGSLFKMKPSTVRIFGDSDRVLASFANQGKPAQRSIAYIADQGLRSGLCLAVGRADQIQGFLFLNSTQRELFERTIEGYAPLLSLFALVTTIALDAHGFGIDRRPERVMLAGLVPNHSVVFRSAEFEQFTRTAIYQLTGLERNVELTYESNASSFLYVPESIAGAIASLVSRIPGHGFTDGNIRLQLERIGARMELRLPHNLPIEQPSTREWIERLIGLKRHENRNLPLGIRSRESSFVIDFPFEPAFDSATNESYSVIY